MAAKDLRDSIPLVIRELGPDRNPPEAEFRMPEEPDESPTRFKSHKGIKWIVCRSSVLDDRFMFLYNKKDLKEAWEAHPDLAIYFPPKIKDLLDKVVEVDVEGAKSFTSLKSLAGGLSRRVYPNMKSKPDTREVWIVKQLNAERKPEVDLEISEVKIHLVNDGTHGLLGWALCVVNSALPGQEAYLRRMLKTSAHFQRLCIDRHDIGMNLAENLRTEFRARVEEIILIGQVKETLAIDLKIAFENETVAIPRTCDLTAQIHSIKKTPTRAGYAHFDIKKERHHTDKF